MCHVKVRWYTEPDCIEPIETIVLLEEGVYPL
jgi:hypothetical protein